MLGKNAYSWSKSNTKIRYPQEKGRFFLQSIQIETEYVTLGQFLKMIDVIGSGGLAKWYLEEYQVYVNGEIEQRRGRKLKPGDQIEIPDVGKFEIIE